MKIYSVLCLGAPSDFASLVSSEVYAENPQEAKKIALEDMRKKGYPDAVIAPELNIPGMPPVVMEIPTKRYRIWCFLTCTEGESLTPVELDATSEEDARHLALNILRHKGYPRAVIPNDIPGMSFKIVQEIKK